MVKLLFAVGLVATTLVAGCTPTQQRAAAGAAVGGVGGAVVGGAVAGTGGAVVGGVGGAAAGAAVGAGL